MKSINSLFAKARDFGKETQSSRELTPQATQEKKVLLNAIQTVGCSRKDVPDNGGLGRQLSDGIKNTRGHGIQSPASPSKISGRMPEFAVDPLHQLLTSAGKPSRATMNNMNTQQVRPMRLLVPVVSFLASPHHGLRDYLAWS